MRPSLSYLQTVLPRKPGSRSGTWCWPSTGRRSPAWSTQKPCTLQGEVGGLQSPAWLWRGRGLKYSREYEHAEVETRRMGAVSLLAWDYRYCLVSTVISQKLNHVSVPCSFRMDGQSQKWNQQTGVRNMCSVYHRYISLNSLPRKISWQEFIYWVSFFLLPFLSSSFLPFFSFFPSFL